MLTCREQNTLTAGMTAGRLRRAVAGLMAVVMFVASFALAARDPAFAIPNKNGMAVEMTTSGKHAAKPCQKAVLPGTASPCLLSSFTINYIPAAGAELAVSAIETVAQWQLRNSWLPPQRSGPSHYRPPCLSV
jgi:hypothetical protein